MIPTEIPEKGFGADEDIVRNRGYTRAHVSGNVATLSGMQGMLNTRGHRGPAPVQSQGWLEVVWLSTESCITFLPGSGNGWLKCFVSLL